MEKKLIVNYNKLKKSFHGNEGQSHIYDIIFDIYHESRLLLSKSKLINLKSLIPNKEYICYENNNHRTRAINKNLINVDDNSIRIFIDKIKTNDIEAYTADEITNICYKIAISFCSAIDLIKSNDQKTPGTFFEYFMGQLFSTNLGITPRKQVEVLNIDNLNSKLPTDFIFDLGYNKPKYHVPVKTSTRERVIQVWAHQRVLDGIYGNGRFLGLLTCLSETKVDQRKLEVTEICLPDQWRIYQLFIAQMKRVYYLDLPEKYKEMNKWYPPIHVHPLGMFFKEREQLMS